MKALITRKIGMTSLVASDGVVSAVTLLEASPNVITQIKTIDKDGYRAAQIGYQETKKAKKPQLNHSKAAGTQPKVSREFRLSDDEEIKVGGILEAGIFAVGDTVQVSGTSKGKGWAGTIKRHNFHRGRKTHGGGSYRRPGSIGSMYPQKIFKGKRMAGQMGNEQVSVRNLKIALVDVENRVIGVTGAVPGPRKGIVLLKESSK